MKKGFTLAELVIALALIAVMSFVFTSTVMFSQSQFAKGVARQTAAMQAQSAFCVFESANFADAAAFSVADFAQKAQLALAATVQPTANGCQISWRTSIDGITDANGALLFDFAVEFQAPNVVLTGKAVFNNLQVLDFGELKKVVAL